MSVKDSPRKRETWLQYQGRREGIGHRRRIKACAELGVHKAPPLQEVVWRACCGRNTGGRPSGGLCGEREGL